MTFLPCRIICKQNITFKLTCPIFLLRIFEEPTKFVISFCLSFFISSSLSISFLLSICCPLTYFFSTFYIRFISFLCLMCFHSSFSLFFSLSLDVYSVILSFFNSRANSALDFKICLYHPPPCPSSSSVTVSVPSDVIQQTSLISSLSLLLLLFEFFYEW
jgi:hypothetical protein